MLVLGADMMGSLDKAETNFGPSGTLAKKASNGERVGCIKGSLGRIYNLNFYRADHDLGKHLTAVFYHFQRCFVKTNTQTSKHPEPLILFLSITQPYNHDQMRTRNQRWT